MSSSPRFGQMREGGQVPQNCPRHPHAPAVSVCKRCGRPTCVDCTVRTEVANVCPDCLSQRSSFRSYQDSLERGRTRPKVAKDASVTKVLIVVTTVVSLLAMFYRPLMGALAFSPLVAYAQPWRFLTVGLVHAGFFHLGLNMLSLYLFGPALERYLGRWRFVAVYLVSIIGGSVMVLLVGLALPGQLLGWTVGASGGLFGLFAGLLVVERLRGSDTTTLLIFLAINFGYGFFVSNVSWQGHLGGIVFGALATWVIVNLARPKPGVTARKQQRTQVLAVSGIVALEVVLALLSYWLLLSSAISVF
ncbi:MAG: rhomboid family intramembrane serine protease [Actinomycetaceae bacterium]|nr:rhomboid family intramembrane serine protease [Actinomycetaceae bacterium]